MQITELQLLSFTVRVSAVSVAECEASKMHNSNLTFRTALQVIFLVAFRGARLLSQKQAAALTPEGTDAADTAACGAHAGALRW